MKVTNEMMDKELRLIGSVYKKILGGIPQKKEVKPKKQVFKKTKEVKGKPYNKYIQREDESYLRLYISKPYKTEQKGPGILWIHGGGYAGGMPEMGSLSMFKPISQRCVVVSPDYRLSIEKPFPAALDDCYQALIWMKENAENLGIRDDQLFVGGESAGGGLAVALCLLSRDTGEVNIAYQMPLYPMLDDRMKTESMKNNDAPIWNEKQNSAAWSLYLDGIDKNLISKYAAPARETDYTDLPPALSFVGGVEPFRDETILYIHNLKNSGVSVEFKVFEGCFHGFDMLAPWTKKAKEARAFFMEHFLYACENYFNPQKNEAIN